MKIVQDFGFELAKNISPPMKIVQEMKIVQDFGFELPKNNPPPPKMKIVQGFGLELAKNTHVPIFQGTSVRRLYRCIPHGYCLVIAVMKSSC